MGKPRISRFWSVALTLAVVYALVKWGIPAASREITGLPFPLPVPGTLIFIYMLLAVIALFLIVTFSDENLAEFLHPIKKLLRGGFGRIPRAAVMTSIPFLAAWQVYQIVVPKVALPPSLRIQHPSSNFPKSFEALKNPFVNALDEQDRWYLANFIKSLQHQLTGHQVLKALPVEGAVPEAPDDAIWAGAEPMDVRLTGQVVAAPRWQNPSIEMVTLKAAFNNTEIAFLIEWDDPFEDVTHDSDAVLDTTELGRVGGYNSYVAANDMVTRKLETFRDAVALQFPVRLPEGTVKPHFMRGAASTPVQLWAWKADLEAGGGRSVEEAIARGWRQPPRVQPEDQSQVNARAVWADGRWRVVMKRPLATGESNDVQFRPGVFIPLAVNAWDGSNGEHGMIMSLSTWYYVLLEAPTPVSVYLLTVLAFLLSAGLAVWLVRLAERGNREPGGPET